MRTGETFQSDLLVGSVSISCISRESVEADQLGHLVFNSFKFFSRTLRSIGFFSIKSLNIGSEVLVEQEGSDDKTWITPITITASIQERWSLDPKTARRLEEVITQGLAFDV